MFQVLIVDDEPAALQYICSLVKMRCPGFQVMATAENGKQCLEILEKQKPDVLLSDVKMPVMDGIQLVRRMKEERLDICTLMISGYQEYEYVRDTLKQGVYDYLLKPLAPAAFSAALEELRVRLEEQKLARCNRILALLSGGGQLPEDELRACFPDAAYNCVLVRKNGLPQRFLYEQALEAYTQDASELSIFGRDAMERLYLRPASDGLEEYANNILGRERSAGNYVTAVCPRRPFPMALFADTVQRLWHTLDDSTVLGQSKVVLLDEPFLREKAPETMDAHMLAQLEYSLQIGNAKRADEELWRLMAQWERDGRPLLWLERQLRYILFIADRYDSGERLLDIDEHFLNDAFYCITNMRDLYLYMRDLLFDNAQNDKPMDSAAYFEHICTYIRLNYPQQISLQSMGQEFAISESYISKIFRKHCGKSFNTFVTEVRMENACRLLQSDPGILVKDVSAMAGYADPFYFSRAFHAYTGKSPKEYLLEMHPDK